MATASVPSGACNPFQTPPPEAALSCGVCLTTFDSGHRRPLILPRCGHTFCRICIKDLATRGDIVCPACRTKYENVEVDELPINFNIQCLATSPSALSLPVTKTKIDEEFVKCMEHEARLAFWCNSCEVAACGECLFELHPRPEHSICRIEEVVQEVKQRAKLLASQSSTDIVKRLAEALMRTLRDVSDLQEAAHLLHETIRLNRTAQTASDLPAITSVFERAKEIRSRVDALDQTQDEEEACLRPRSEAVIATRPAILALNESGCLAKVLVEKRGIHLHSLQPASTAYSVAIKLGILISCVSKETPTVFMDIKAGERKLGRVYIELNGKMRRGQQFMALCLGTLGSTYKGTRFDGVSEKDQPGEYIRGGDYQGRKGMGGEALMDNLEWGGSWSKPKKAGQLVGVGGEMERKFGSLFAVCLRDDPSDQFKAPFGDVVEGLDVLQVASRHNPFNMVYISDCGVVLPLGVPAS